NDETIARSPGNNWVAACRSTPCPSISSNMPLSAMMPSSRSRSFLCSACGRIGDDSSRTIEGLLEGRVAEPAVGVDERLLRAFAGSDIGVDQPLDGVRHRLGDKTRPQDLADGGILRGIAADGD